MAQFMTPCPKCEVLNRALEQINDLDWPDGVEILATTEGCGPDGDRGQAPVRKLALSCRVCGGVGYLLTEEGQRFAALVGRELKGTVIV